MHLQICEISRKSAVPIYCYMYMFGVQSYKNGLCYNIKGQFYKGTLEKWPFSVIPLQNPMVKSFGSQNMKRWVIKGLHCEILLEDIYKCTCVSISIHKVMILTDVLHVFYFFVQKYFSLGPQIWIQPYRFWKNFSVNRRQQKHEITQHAES